MTSPARRPAPAPPRRPARAGGVVTLLCLLAAGGAAAQPTAEVSAGVESVSGVYADGRTLDARLTLPRPSGFVRVSAGVLDRFGQGTLVVGLDGAHDLGPRWVVGGAVGGSTAGLVAPRSRASLSVARRWAERANVLTTATVGVRETRDGHRDLDLTAEGAVYGPRAVVQVGGRLTRSVPGPVWGGRAFAAATLGDPAGEAVTVRLGVGREAWTVLAPDARLDVAFRSGEAAVAWRRPVAGPWAVTLEGGLYANPYYTRVGLRTGLTRTFR